jgi:hypothetical protein
MNAQQKTEVLSWSNVIAFEWQEDGVPKEYPPHVHEGKVYAYKPIIINETLHKYKSIFWLDAGSTLTGPITPAEDIVHRTGIYLVKGQDADMKDKSHPTSYSWFGYNKATFSGGPSYSGNTIAAMTPSRYTESVFGGLAECALDTACIKPEGSNLGNHRYDQTALSILAYGSKVCIPHHTEYLAADRTQLEADMTKPSLYFVWTARNKCTFYSDREKA